MSESSEWVGWVGPARKGDVEAIEKLENYFSPFVHAVLLSRLSHKMAATLVKPVLAQTVFRLGGLAHDEGFGTWVLTAAREKAFDVAKTPGATVDVPGPDPLVNNGHIVLGRIRVLSETARERLIMRLLEGIAGFEIAEVAGAKEPDVRIELERAAGTLVQQLTGQAVAFAGDNYLWSLVGTPHPALIPLENQLTALRYDPSVDPEATPIKPQPPLPRRSAPEGRRQTGAALKPLAAAEITDPSSEGLPLPDEENTAANPVPAGEKLTMQIAAVRPVPRQEQMTMKVPVQPSLASDPVNPFGTAVKTIHVSDLPAAADFADLQGTRPEVAEPWGHLADEGDPSTQVQSIGEVRSRVDAADTQVRLQPVEMPTQVRPSGGLKPPGKSLPPPVDHEALESDTVIRPSGPGAWRASSVVGNPAPLKTIMGLPAIIVARGSVTRSWRPFGVAGVFALIAVGVAMLLFDGTNRRIRSGWNLVPVVVAATDLTEGTIITLEMISTRSVPENFVTASVVKPDSTTYVVNQKILVGAQAGDPLLWSQFEVSRSNERLSKKVMKRARAYDIMTSRAIAVGGWVQPNDRIDIIVTLKANERGTVIALTLLQDVPVLSTGKITSSTPNSAKKDGDRDYIDVSVLLLPEEAEIVALATEVGELQFTLRTENDHEVLNDHRGTSSKTLLQGERVRLLQLKRMKTIQQIRNAPAP